MIRLIDSLKAHKVLHCRLLLLAGLLIGFAYSTNVMAQNTDELTDPEPLIEVAPGKRTDLQIQNRIEAIFKEIDTLSAVDVEVNNGVVILAGAVANDSQAQRALDLAIRLEGVVTVEDSIERTLALNSNLSPLIEQTQTTVSQWVKGLPLVLFAILMFLVVAYIGHRIAKLSLFWRRWAPNPFIAELFAQALRIAAIILGLVVALNIMGATALISTILGGAGLLGLAIGFAVRDSLENYISSIMLSLRQPFRANDHVSINDYEGKVMRLTSRATILMTLEGNHLRIPNSQVFKAVILNYSRNPERRFDFKLGIDAEDNPIAAIKTGLDAIRSLDFILLDSKPVAIIDTVGDSSIIIHFMAWVNQQQTDFYTARSLAISAAKNALEDDGFTLPEPIYRLRFDELPLQLPEQPAGEPQSQPDEKAARPMTAREATTRKPVRNSDEDEALDTRPDTHLERKVDEERAQEPENDLLDHSVPVE